MWGRASKTVLHEGADLKLDGLVNRYWVVSEEEGGSSAKDGFKLKCIWPRSKHGSKL